MTAFMPLHLPRIGVAEADVPAWTGRIVALSSIIGIPFLPLWGALADRYSRKPIIIRSFVANMLGGVIMLFASNVWVFAIGRSVVTFALGNTGLMMTTLSERVPRERQGLAFAIFRGSLPVGAFLGPLAGGPVFDSWGLSALLAIDAALMSCVILAMTFGYTDRFRGTASTLLFQMAIDSIFMILRSPRLRAIFFALFLLHAAWMLGNTYVALAVTEVYSGGDLGKVVGVVMGAAGLATLVLAPAMGAGADRIGHWRMLFLATGVQVFLWPVPMFATGVVSFTLTWAVLGGVASGVLAISFTVLSSSSPSVVRGRVMSLSSLPMIVGLMVGPAIGSVVTRCGISTVFPVAAVATALGLAALVVAERQAAAPFGAGE